MLASGAATHAGFSMVMSRKVFVDRFVVEGTSVEQTNNAGSDSMTVTVPTPASLTPSLDMLGGGDNILTPTATKR